MRTRSRVVTALAAALGTALGAVLAAGPASGGTTTAESSMGSVVVTVPDATWVEDGCLEVPVTATGSVVPDVSWSAGLSARRSGSGTRVTAGLRGSGPETVDGSLLLCPTTNGPGTYTVSVTADFTDYAQGGAETTATGTTSFTLSRMPSATSVTSVRVRSSGATVRGRVTVQSAEFGRMGADFETVVVQVRRSGGDWRRLADGFTDEMGRFTVTSYDPLPSGSRVRAVFRRTTVAEASTSPAVRP